MQAQQVLQGRYQLQEQLGQNACRQTWIAEDLETKIRQKVIVKMLAFSPQMQWEELKLFEREAQVLKHLNHPKIPRYRDYFSIDDGEGSGLPWFGLVQDYIPGSSLGQMLDAGKRFTEDQAKQIATQVLKILIYLHELSPPVLHRDIKPSNLIMGEDGQVYLVDFGAVQDRAKAQGVTFTVVGTSGYAPPEQLWGKAVPVSDLYALGATLIHLLTGTAPADLPQHQMRLEFRDKVNLNPGFANWIEQLTEPAPEKRFASAKEALRELQAPRHFSGKINQSAEDSVNYGRLILLSLCATILSGCVVFVPLLILLPNLLSGTNNKTKQTEAKQYVSSMNRSQQAYHLEYGKFVTSDNRKGWDKLGIGITTKTSNYIYSFHGRDKAVFNYAISKDDNLKSYVGGVFVVSDVKGKLTTQAIVCESNFTMPINLNEPTYQNGAIACGTGTKNIAKY
ncbi:protein kinase domain-containing protein [Microseira wollei]|uniref:Serine/threonine protein kinase n=1 Tax=Microseira wollei NIES-4236 TaxID=2530354 RepID=A0AAV3XJI5_9CYAN|nr:type IV pilin-like G/H family protein [Microseira wollei]GET41190.1 serine/threonine protein kinase [Microseira wollei NIES-4236]